MPRTAKIFGLWLCMELNPDLGFSKINLPKNLMWFLKKIISSAGLNFLGLAYQKKSRLMNVGWELCKEGNES